ncbi:hypothetical protein [Candidatus Accumulibacter sp. ACC003]|uniref:hypothetical protein n=1 Tax=Candidatus Accumulibacter sp. ACC003 TaxID=2823334 RepID=UPI0025BD5DC1|nr:hypothetical protein [Candidatus Accumulibacter sp. ACC003]
MRIRTAILTAALALLPLAAAAQQPATAEALTAVGPGHFAGVVEAQVTLVVEAIDPASRGLVLRDDKGEKMAIIASDAVKNFAQIKVGDQVIASYTQGLDITLVKDGKALRERVESTSGGSAKPGEKPAAQVVNEVAFIADVTAVDRKKQVITLRGATKTVKLKIKDPEQLKLINKGDQVEGVYAQALAVSVVPAGSKAKKK